MNIEPRFDAYRSFERPDRVVLAAVGVIAGKLWSGAIEVSDNDPAFSTDEDVLRRNLEPMLREWWGEKVSEATGGAY